MHNYIWMWIITLPTLPNNVYYIIQDPVSVLKTKLIYKIQVNIVQKQ